VEEKSGRQSAMQTKTFAVGSEKLKQEPRTKGAVVAVVAMILMMSGAFIISEQVTKAVAHAVGVNLPVSVSSLLPFGKTVIPKAQPVKIISTPSLVPAPATSPVSVIRHTDTGTQAPAKPASRPSAKSPAPKPTPTTPIPTPTTESPTPDPTPTPTPTPTTESPTPIPTSTISIGT
jgi:hypothetical protein